MIENKKQVIETLQKVLISYPAQNKAYDCLLIMVQGALTVLKDPTVKDKPGAYSRRDLKEAIDGNRQADALDSKGLSKWIQLKDLNGYLDNLIRTHGDLFEQLPMTPVVKTSLGNKGGRGNETLFWIDVVENIFITVEVEDDVQQEQEATWTPYISYTRVPSPDIKISFLLKPFFRQGQMRNRSAKGLIFWGGIIFSFAYASLSMLFLSIALVNLGQKIASVNIFLMLTITGGFIFLFKDAIWPMWRLPEHRVIKAPTFFLSFMEMDADIEMHRDEQRNQHTRFTRFEATCSICGAHVRLKTGKPDQGAPLVGRCNESPHAHVYSFDRVHLTGKLLNDWAAPKDMA